jgi:DNA-binding NarL/FixJ family response regulator
MIRNRRELERIFLRRAEEQTSEVKSLRYVPPKKEPTEAKPKPPTQGEIREARAEKVQRLHTEGKSDTEIAAELGIPRATATFIRTRLGLWPNRRKR